MPFQYKHVLMVGATSGIGAALADRLVQEGSKVIAVGRRQNRLDNFVRQHGKDKVSSYTFDITDKQKLDGFVKDITDTYPDLDCVFLNAGTQHVTNLSEPAKVDLDAFHSEINVNFTSFVDLTVKFLPFLISKKTETSIIYTTSHIALVPASVLPAYSASKAALNAFILCLRNQIRDTPVKIIELLPPVVQTELHDYIGPERGRKLGMPADEFADQAYKGLASGSDQVLVGGLGLPGQGNKIDPLYKDFIGKRRTAFEGFADIMRSHA